MGGGGVFIFDSESKTGNILIIFEGREAGVGFFVFYSETKTGEIPKSHIFSGEGARFCRSPTALTF